ncbi:hypothetical protein BH10PSE2_BH10PSE2_24540 [soil metagenome]
MTASGDGGGLAGGVPDDGLDGLRRDLIDLVLREAGGRVAADATSPVARLLTGIVRREMATAVDILRRDEAARGSPSVQTYADPGFRSGGIGPLPANRARDAMLLGGGAVAALLLFGAGYLTAGLLARPTAVPVVAAPASIDPTQAEADPAAIAAATTAATVSPPARASTVAPVQAGRAQAGSPPAGSVDGSTGMATQLRDRPR